MAETESVARMKQFIREEYDEELNYDTSVHKHNFKHYNDHDTAAEVMPGGKTMDFEEFEKYKDVEFKAYSRALLRILKGAKEALENGDKERALKVINELIEDTKKDIEG